MLTFLADYRSVPLRLISLGPNDDRTCFEGVIITDEICLEDEESFTLDIEEPSQAGVELGLDSTTINIIDDCGTLLACTIFLGCVTLISIRYISYLVPVH